MIATMKLRLLGNIVRRLKARIRKHPELEGQKVIVTDEMINKILLSDLGGREGLEGLIESVVDDWIEQLEALNESLRSRN